MSMCLYNHVAKFYHIHETVVRVQMKVSKCFPSTLLQLIKWHQQYEDVQHFLMGFQITVDVQNSLSFISVCKMLQ